MIASIVLKLLVVFAGLVYTGLVLTGYATDGPHYQPRLHLTDPLRSVQRLLVWTGIRILHVFLKLVRSLADQLFAASAEVGTWVIEKSSPNIQRKVRERFL